MVLVDALTDIFDLGNKQRSQKMSAILYETLLAQEWYYNLSSV
jgi:hypothetical protein